MESTNSQTPMSTKTPKIHYVLWVVQSILALLFVFSGATKFTMPLSEMQKGASVHFPLMFYYFIGLCEILGGIGLILPSALKIKPMLTPLAALGLIIIMIGAVTVTLMSGMGAMAIVPAVVGLLCAFIAWGRYFKQPILPKS